MQIKTLNIALRGHIRDSFDDDQLYQFIKSLTTTYTCTIFIHTWNIRRSNVSWRQMERDVSEITEETIREYCRDLPVEKILIDDDRHVQLHGSTTGRIGGYTCPKIGWKYYWYGQKRVAEAIEDPDSLVLNMRFDMFTGPFNPPVTQQGCLAFVERHVSQQSTTMNFMHGNQYICGLDNMYIGRAKSMQELAAHFHLNLDKILQEDGFKTLHQELLVLSESRRLGL